MEGAGETSCLGFIGMLLKQGMGNGNWKMKMGNGNGKSKNVEIVVDDELYFFQQLLSHILETFFAKIEGICR